MSIDVCCLETTITEDCTFANWYIKQKLIGFTIFRLIWNETEFCLIRNKLKNHEHNQIPFHLAAHACRPAWDKY